jgi:hypothetical protein
MLVANALKGSQQFLKERPIAPREEPLVILSELRSFKGISVYGGRYPEPFFAEKAAKDRAVAKVISQYQKSRR